MKMSYIIVKGRGKDRILPVKILTNPKTAQVILQPLRWKILCQLAAQPSYARKLANNLGVSEQAVCYHIRELEKLGFIRLEKTVGRRGALAKYYAADKKAVAVISNSWYEEAEAVKSGALLTDEFRKIVDFLIENGKLKAAIIVGSPDVHGEFKARARCGHFAVDLALFLGSLLPIARDLVVKLDTEMKESDLTDNLIVVGGPRVNTIAAKVNDKLPIKFELTAYNMIVSKITGKAYYGEEDGVIEIIENPFNRESKIILLAGNTYIGTKAAVTGFIKYTEKIADGNSTNPNVLAKVVSGVDLNSDGLIDDVEFLE
jgi:DNA-binding MarR family transcriptional regulator